MTDVWSRDGLARSMRSPEFGKEEILTVRDVTNLLQGARVVKQTVVSCFMPIYEQRLLILQQVHSRTNRDIRCWCLSCVTGIVF
jgi:hypothetical protein